MTRTSTRQGMPNGTSANFQIDGTPADMVSFPWWPKMKDPAASSEAAKLRLFFRRKWRNMARKKDSGEG